MDINLIKEYSRQNKTAKIYVDDDNIFHVVTINDMGTTFRSSFDNLPEAEQYANIWIFS